MTLLGETDAGNAGMQPCQGIAWWAHQDDERRRKDHLLTLPQTSIGSVDPDALKIPARRAEYSLTENALSPFQAEPTHNDKRKWRGHLGGSHSEWDGGRTLHGDGDGYRSSDGG